MERARRILEKARSTLANERIWMKSALVERERGQTEDVTSCLMKILLACTKIALPGSSLCTPPLHGLHGSL